MQGGGGVLPSFILLYIYKQMEEPGSPNISYDHCNPLHSLHPVCDDS